VKKKPPGIKKIGTSFTISQSFLLKRPKILFILDQKITETIDDFMNQTISTD